MSEQVLMDQCDCAKNVGTKTCGKIKCAKDRKNIINQNSRNRKKAKLGTPKERLCSICEIVIDPERTKNRATTCAKRSCYNERKRRDNLKKKNIDDLIIYVHYLNEQVHIINSEDEFRAVYVFYTTLEPQHLGKIREACMKEAKNILIWRRKNYVPTQSDYENREELQNLLTTLQENNDINDIQDLVELDLHKVQAAGMATLEQIITQLNEMVAGRVYFQFSIPKIPYHRMFRKVIPPVYGELS